MEGKNRTAWAQDGVAHHLRSAPTSYLAYTSRRRSPRAPDGSWIRAAVSPCTRWRWIMSTNEQPARYLRYMRYTAYVCMYGWWQKGAEISLMGVRFLA